jgi:hypothetical protein
MMKGYEQDRVPPNLPASFVPTEYLWLRRFWSSPFNAQGEWDTEHVWRNVEASMRLVLGEKGAQWEQRK